jgi:hypothetical protein
MKTMMASAAGAVAMKALDRLHDWRKAMTQHGRMP